MHKYPNLSHQYPVGIVKWIYCPRDFDVEYEDGCPIFSLGGTKLNTNRQSFENLFAVYFISYSFPIYLSEEELKVGQEEEEEEEEREERRGRREEGRKRREDGGRKRESFAKNSSYLS